MTDLTPIPPGFKITYCPPGIARNVEPTICRSTGRPGAPAFIFRDSIAEHGIGKGKPKPRAKHGEGQRYEERKAWREKEKLGLPTIRQRRAQGEKICAYCAREVKTVFSICEPCRKKRKDSLNATLQKKLARAKAEEFFGS